MSNVEMMPIESIWLTPEQAKIPMDKSVLVASAAEPIFVARHPKLGANHYQIIEGVERFKACEALGARSIKCVVQFGCSFFQDLRACEDQLMWADMAQKLLDQGCGIEMLVEESHLPRSVVLDRLAVRKVMNKALADAEAHGKVLGKAEKTQDENEQHYYTRRCPRGCTHDTHGCQKFRCNHGISSVVDDYGARISNCNECTKSGAAVCKHKMMVAYSDGTMKCAGCNWSYWTSGAGPEMSQAEFARRYLPAGLTILQREEVNRLYRSTRKRMNQAEPICTKCGKATAVDNGLCIECAKAKAVEDAKTPKERGKVLCLEPKCPKWIKDPMRRVLPLSAVYYFCKEHQTCEHQGNSVEVLATYSGQVRRSLNNMPIFDRDGDPIWITRDVEVMKIRHMENSHLTNCLTFLEASARRRCQVTKIDESKWTEFTTERYRHLVKEAQRRDERLRCTCKDGVRSVSSVTSTDTFGTETEVTEELCTECQLGRDRKMAKQAAEALAKERKGKAMTVKMAMVMVVSLIIGGALAPGSHVVEWFLGYLRMHGLLK